MKKRLIRIYLLILFLAGVAALGIVFFREPTVQTAFQTFTGAFQSSVRKGVVLFLAAAVSLGTFTALLVLVISFLNPEWFESLLRRLEDILRRRVWFLVTAAFLLLGAFISGQLSLPADYLEDPLQRALLDVLRPVFLYGAFINTSFLGLILVLKGRTKIFWQPSFLWTTVVFLGLTGTGYLLHRLGYGMIREPGVETHFDFTGNPLLGYQVILALIGAGMFAAFQALYRGRREEKEQLFWRLFDGFTVILIFLSAVLLWNSSSLQPHTFVDQPRPPNYEFYPDSDALLYDRTAQSLLAAGRLQSYLSGYSSPSIALRPGLTFYQAVLHALGGLGYEDILPFQIFAFAFWPVLIYLLTTLIHRRASGFLAALLIMIRDFNGQVMANIDAGVHARLLESEIPMIMGLLFFLVLFQMWKKGGWKNLTLPLLAGGVIGWAVLIRLEAVLIVLVVGAVTLIWLFPRIQKIFPGFVLLTFGLLLVISPWVYRNWQLTGDIFLNRPDNRMDLLQDSFQRLKEEVKGEARIPGVRGVYQARDLDFGRLTPAVQQGHLAAVPLPVEAGKPYASRYLQEELDVSFLDHFSNNLVQSVVFLPGSPLYLNLDFLSKLAIGKIDRYYGGIFYSPEKYVKSLPYWSRDWDGTIAAQSLILVFLNVFVISLGAYAVWRRDKHMFWVLGCTYIIYVSLYSLIHRSGGRSLQISDWVVLIFYSVGLIEVVLQFLTPGRKSRGILTGGLPGERLSLNALSLPSSKLSLGFLALGLVFLGSLPPLSEVVLPDHYPSDEMEAITSDFLEPENSPFSSQEITALTRFLDSGGEVVWGRGLYPRQFFAGESTLETKIAFYGPLERTDYARFEYFSAGTANIWVVLKRGDSLGAFPHGSSVLSIGCHHRGNLDVLAAVLFTEADEVEDIYWREGNLDEFTGCPLPW